MRETETRAGRFLDLLLRQNRKYRKILRGMRETETGGTGKLDLLLRQDREYG